MAPAVNRAGKQGSGGEGGGGSAILVFRAHLIGGNHEKPDLRILVLPDSKTLTELLSTSGENNKMPQTPAW